MPHKAKRSFAGSRTLPSRVQIQLFSSFTKKKRHKGASFVNGGVVNLNGIELTKE